MSCGLGLLLASQTATLLLDTGSLTGQVAQVVQLSATNPTNLVHLNALNVGRLQWEDTLYANSTRHLANSETLLLLMAANLDNDTTEELDTLLRTLDNFVSDSYSVTSLEARVLLAGCCLPVANASSATLIKSIVTLNL